MNYTKQSALIDASVAVIVSVFVALIFLVEKTSFWSHLLWASAAYALAALCFCSNVFPHRSAVLKFIHAVTSEGMKTRSEANGIVCGILFVIAATSVLIYALIAYSG